MLFLNSANRLSINGANATMGNSAGYVTLSASINDVVYNTIQLYRHNTEANAITIDNVDELIAFRDAVNDYANGVYKGISNNNNGFWDYYFKLADDIDLSTVCNKNGDSWTPIGTKDTPFRGNFNGGNHV